jgi:hypothetical protein
MHRGRTPINGCDDSGRRGHSFFYHKSRVASQSEQLDPPRELPFELRKDFEDNP